MCFATYGCCHPCFSMTSEYTEVRASRSKIPLKENVQTIKIQQEQSKPEPRGKTLSAEQEKRWKTRQVYKRVKFVDRSHFK